MPITSYRDLEVWQKAMRLIGSVAEIETQFSAAERLGFARHRHIAKVYRLCNDLSRMLTKLRRSLEPFKSPSHRGPRTSAP